MQKKNCSVDSLRKLIIGTKKKIFFVIFLEKKRIRVYQSYIDNGATLSPTLLFIPLKRHPDKRRNSIRFFFFNLSFM